MWEYGWWKAFIIPSSVQISQHLWTCLTNLHWLAPSGWWNMVACCSEASVLSVQKRLETLNCALCWSRGLSGVCFCLLLSDCWGSTCPCDPVIRNQLNNNKGRDSPITAAVVCVDAAHRYISLEVHISVPLSNFISPVTWLWRRGAIWPWGHFVEPSCELLLTNQTSGRWAGWWFMGLHPSYCIQPGLSLNKLKWKEDIWWWYFTYITSGAPLMCGWMEIFCQFVFGVVKTISKNMMLKFVHVIESQCTNVLLQTRLWNQSKPCVSEPLLSTTFQSLGGGGGD